MHLGHGFLSGRITLLKAFSLPLAKYRKLFVRLRVLPSLKSTQTVDNLK